MKPRRRSVSMLVGLVMLGCLASSGSAASWHIEVVDLAFQPASKTMRVGDTAHWMSSNTGELHNVRQFDKIFYSGAESRNIDFARKFSAGTFKYFCERHQIDGMRGVVKVPVILSAGPTGAPFAVRWAVTGTQTGSRFDVEYRVGAGDWKRWKTGTTARNAVFGADGNPVRAVNGKTYSIRTRSKTTRASSLWSPVKSFTP